MTAAEFRAKWFDHPENRKIITGEPITPNAPGNRFYKQPLLFPDAGLPDGVEHTSHWFPPGGSWIDLSEDYVSVPKDERKEIDLNEFCHLWRPELK